MTEDAKEPSRQDESDRGRWKVIFAVAVVLGLMCGAALYEFNSAYNPAKADAAAQVEEKGIEPTEERPSAPPPPQYEWQLFEQTTGKSDSLRLLKEIVEGADKIESAATYWFSKHPTDPELLQLNGDGGEPVYAGTRPIMSAARNLGYKQYLDAHVLLGGVTSKATLIRVGGWNLKVYVRVRK